ncbi:uncharacterized protein E5676_scaffold177G001500 [Cucumis melo var. makuwa]|uniref:Retrotransposon gag domain-containing protein n=1 Tax=Cucumis melo var. makuwa TaxID=1194695 RepID=A0A5D3CNF6_CUCMM|nr:uncharacterized protein E5676_scaffold177G001500 [Cucumis melo var. makuwa]
MSSANPSGKSRLDKISKKTDTIDAVAGRVEGLPIQELLARVDTLKTNISVGGTVNYERGDSSSGFAVHMEERVSELDSSQKTLLEMINGISEDFRVPLDVVRNEIADVNARLNLTMRAMANQAPAGGAISVSRVKIPEPNPFCGARDAKALENYIFYLEQYFKATNIITEEAKKLHDVRHTGEIREYVKQFAGLMLDIRDMSEKDKVFCFFEGLKPWVKAKLYEQRVQDLTSAYAAAEWLFDLTSDSQDRRRHQSSSLRRNRNSRPSSPKAVRGDKCSGKDRRSHQ